MLVLELFCLVLTTSHETSLHHVGINQARCLSLMECLIYAYENCFILDVVILTESISSYVAGCELIIGTVVSIAAMLLEIQLKIICWKNYIQLVTFSYKYNQYYTWYWNVICRTLLVNLSKTPTV
jgi:hypothetical protein